jgi:pimeloyl-ACP methyl ester carboxylesterase
MSVEGQIEELEELITASTEAPIIAVGYSWGAWLGLMLAAKRPELVKKLILVGSGAFDDRYVQQLGDTRISRLTVEERQELKAITRMLEDPQVADKDNVFRRFGEIFSRTDSFDPIYDDGYADDIVSVSSDIFNSVWPQAAAMRTSGELLSLALKVRCPVVAIHGDYDPTPAEGVEKPLADRLERFKFVLIEKCGHTPWIERHARTTFFQILSDELKAGAGSAPLTPRPAA